MLALRLFDVLTILFQCYSSFFYYIFINETLQYQKMKGIDLYFQESQDIDLTSNSSLSNYLSQNSITSQQEMVFIDIPEENILSHPDNSLETLFQALWCNNNDLPCCDQVYCLQNDRPHEIDDPGQGDLTLAQGLMISKFISIPKGNHENQEQPNLSQMNPQTNLMISQNQDDEPEQNHSQTSHSNSTQNQSRKNDSNNAHKKIFTALNKAIPPAKRKLIKQLVKKAEKNHGLKLQYVKASRYGFIQKLLQLRHFFGNVFISALSAQFSKQLDKLLQKNQNTQDSQAKFYLAKLPSYYKNSFEEFMSGSVESATETLYKMDKFKQQTYMRQGVQKVTDLIKKFEALQE